MSEPAKTPPFGVRVRDAVLDLPLKRTAKAVLAAIVCHADHNSGECWPSTSTLATLAGTTRETVSRTIRAELVPSGLVAIVRAGGGSHSNRYRVALGDLLTQAEQARAARASKRRKPSRTCDAGSQGAVTLDHRAPRSTITGGCDAGSQGAVTGAHTNREVEQVRGTGNGNRESEPARASPSQQQQRAPRVLRFPVPAAAAAVECDSSEPKPEPDATELRARVLALKGAKIGRTVAEELAAMPWNTPERIKRARAIAETTGKRNPPGFLVSILREPEDPPDMPSTAKLDRQAEEQAERDAEAQRDAREHARRERIESKTSPEQLATIAATPEGRRWIDGFTGGQRPGLPWGMSHEQWVSALIRKRLLASDWDGHGEPWNPAA